METICSNGKTKLVRLDDYVKFLINSINRNIWRMFCTTFAFEYLQKK